MFDWREKIEINDPNNKRVQLEFCNWNKKNSEIVCSWEEAILSACIGMDVLDVGAIGHNKMQVNSADWRHKKIKKVSASCVGVDILEDMVNWINTKGYNFVCMDATSDGYIGKSFDIVIMGDLIEHVDNLKGLLLFAKRHCKDNGKIFITTPNPFYYNRVLNIKKVGLQINMEHTCWITPSNMNELCYRSELYFSKTYYVIPPIWWHKKLLAHGLPMEWFAFDYIYELKNINHD